MAGPVADAASFRNVMQMLGVVLWQTPSGHSRCNLLLTAERNSLYPPCSTSHATPSPGFDIFCKLACVIEHLRNIYLSKKRKKYRMLLHLITNAYKVGHGKWIDRWHYVL